MKTRQQQLHLKKYHILTNFLLLSVCELLEPLSKGIVITQPGGVQALRESSPRETKIERGRRRQNIQNWPYHQLFKTRDSANNMSYACLEINFDYL